MQKLFLIKCLLLFFYFLLLVNSNQNCFSQINIAPANVNSKRITGIVIAESAITTLGFTALHYLWYKKFPRSKFHLFNDNSEWMGMDKFGHATSAYTLSAIQYNIMRWGGINNNRSAIIGGLTALGVQSLIEIFDGYSAEWGFSKGDMLANVIGTTLFVSQQLTWKDQRVMLKFSFHKTLFAKYNPNELGKSGWERWLKDYNGQTYWLSINPASFMKTDTQFPKWANLAFGYGAEGMIGASSNPKKIGNTEIPYFKRYRQYYFSLDADINRIVNKPNATMLFRPLPNLFKLPSPTLEFSKNKVAKFYPIYF